MKKLLRTMSCLLIFGMIISGINNTQVSALLGEGICGSNAKWELVFDTGVLTITGSGKIANSPWLDCESYIQEVVIGDEIEEIGKDVFSGCENLQKVTFGKNVKVIESGAFQNCTSLCNVLLNSNLQAIGDNAFTNCISLKSITIPNSVTEIERAAFSNCTSLETIKLSNKIISLKPHTFLDCKALEKIIIPDSVTEIDNAFSGCASLKRITIPDSVTKIGDYTFENCTSLSSVRLGIHLDSIGNNAFSNCSSLTSILIPDSVTDIGEDAFKGCASEFVMNGYQNSYAEKYGLDSKNCNFEYSENPFIDVSQTDSYYNVIDEAYRLGLMVGTSDYTFNPSAEVTRAQIATVLYRMAGSPEVTYTKIFSDVPKGNYYSKAVTWAYQNGIVKGNEDKTFKPGDYITRQEMVIMLKNLMDYCQVDTSKRADLSRFADRKAISGWATESVQWAIASSILSGKVKDAKLYVDPKANVTRAECCRMLLITYCLIHQ